MRNPSEPQRLFGTGDPNLHHTYTTNKSSLDLIEENDKVAVRLRFTGTHSAELCGAPATEKKISFEALEIFRMENQQIVESWGYWPDMQIKEMLLN